MFFRRPPKDPSILTSKLNAGKQQGSPSRKICELTIVADHLVPIIKNHYYNNMFQKARAFYNCKQQIFLHKIVLAFLIIFPMKLVGTSYPSFSPISEKIHWKKLLSKCCGMSKRLIQFFSQRYDSNDVRLVDCYFLHSEEKIPYHLE